ncbi:helix-turn-helix domain-containing protein [Amycolatopsis magusensis]|uniref:helix-turn-helix domain-containing protein n=1 Tax=Amycolatopsis magusensis TaxID=882444 RepID=UPI003C2BC0B4
MTDEQPRKYEPKHRPGTTVLGHATQRRRERLKITQEDVAERFGGPSVASLRTIENAQAGNYRAKTLFSLDHALSWPRGTAMALLTGQFDRVSDDDKATFHEEHGIDLFDVWGPDDPDFDRFVSVVITKLTDDDLEQYNIPVQAARPPGASSTEDEEFANKFGDDAEMHLPVTPRKPSSEIPSPRDDGDDVTSFDYIMSRLPYLEEHQLLQLAASARGIASTKQHYQRQLEEQRINLPLPPKQVTEPPELDETSSPRFEEIQRNYLRLIESEFSYQIHFEEARNAIRKQESARDRWMMSMSDESKAVLKVANKAFDRARDAALGAHHAMESARAVYSLSLERARDEVNHGKR